MSKTVIILGASGIIGQHMRLQVPDGVKPIWVRSKADRMHIGIDLDISTEALTRLILDEKPHAVVNLASQADVDAVGKDPEKYHRINVVLPGMLAAFCQRLCVHYVHVSSQAVFDGDHAPYHEDSSLRAVNTYGSQKIEAEQRVRQMNSGWTIVRPSFVIGVRPMPCCGRKNPIEQMAEGQVNQVQDRWFTACTANETAYTLWSVAIGEPHVRVIHVEGTESTTRYRIANAMGGERVPVANDSFAGISPRPYDTTFMSKPVIEADFAAKSLAALYHDRQLLGPLTRKREISLFTGMSEFWCGEKLRKGFSILHDAVSDDFRAANPKNDDELLEWYRKTDAYIWELSAYHLDAGFNYAGMCNGLAASLVAFEHTRNDAFKRVIVLGDGIGDMTLTLRRAGIDAVYHDLSGSRTSEFAKMRLWMYMGEECESLMSFDWRPPKVMPESYDAICAADFMEHLPNVEEWVKWIFDTLRPGGVLFAQNAFACGSGENGGMPMHLARNDRFEKDWDPFLESVGFKQISSNWYEKPVTASVEPYASMKTV